MAVIHEWGPHLAIGSVAGTVVTRAVQPVNQTGTIIIVISFLSVVFASKYCWRQFIEQKDGKTIAKEKERLGEDWVRLKRNQDNSHDGQLLAQDQRVHINTEYRDDDGIRGALLSIIELHKLRFESRLNARDGEYRPPSVNLVDGQEQPDSDMLRLSDEDYQLAHSFGSYINHRMLDDLDDENNAVFTTELLDDLRWHIENEGMADILRNCTLYDDEDIGLYLFIMFEKADCSFEREWGEISRIIYHELMDPKPNSRVILDELYLR
jgi:cell division protein FtsL